MQAKDIHENQYVYFRWKCGVCRGVVRGIAHDRVILHFIERVVDNRIEPITDALPVLFMPVEDVYLNSWSVEHPR